MKKYIAALTFIVGILLISSSFSSSESDNDNVTGDTKTVSSADVWDHMHENVFPELNDLVNYDKESMFSRCPTGFSQRMDDELSDNHTVYGNVTFAQGCDRRDFCFYKINWEEKETFLKKKEKEDFVAVDKFVENEKKKIARI